MFPPPSKSHKGSTSGRSAFRSAPAISLMVLPLVLTLGCQPHMTDQPRVDTLQASEAFPDGLGQRHAVAGTIARGELPAHTPVETGLRDGHSVPSNPLPLSQDLLNRGQQRFKIYCLPCHGMAGFADGIVVQRGFPAPPSYHIDRLLKTRDGDLFKVITHGFGRMPPFSKRIEPRDRWAIVAYVRALQLSQGAALEELPAIDKKPFLTSEGRASE